MAEADPAAASLAMLGMHVAASRYFGIPWWYGTLVPIAYSLAAVLAADGILARCRGEVTWKGRVYAAGGHDAVPPLPR